MPAPSSEKDPLFSAAVLKLSMLRKGLADTPGFRVVYAGTLKDLKVTDAEVEAYIRKNAERLDAHLSSAVSKE